MCYIPILTTSLGMSLYKWLTLNPLQLNCLELNGVYSIVPSLHTVAVTLIIALLPQCPQKYVPILNEVLFLIK